MNYQPENIGSIYKDIISQYGEKYLKKPKPGDRYVKMKEPISGIDRPVFRSLPKEILITQPPRLFRSTAWKYQGRVYKDDNPFWEFEYESEGRKEWIALRILSYCYEKFENKGQLKLF
jgi:hypothetical protein